jgi:tetratricopeptide (TPR) repeat protein
MTKQPRLSALLSLIVIQVVLLVGCATTTSTRSNEKIDLLPEIDTEKSISNALDHGGPPVDVWVLNDTVPKTKIIFYKRGEVIHPILFAYDDKKQAFVFQNMSTLKIEEFDRKKHTYEYKQTCLTWYSNTLAIRSNQYSKNNEYEKAYKCIQQLETTSPIGVDAYNGAAWFYTTCKDGKYRDLQKAKELAEKSIGIKKLCKNLDTLAAIYSLEGNFDKAVELEEEAIGLATKEEQEKGKYKEILGAYRNHIPYDEGTR